MICLAIDQGGTKTCALVCDGNGNVLGTGRAIGACWSVSGADAAMTSCEDALRQAGYRWSDLDRLCAALTGADWPDEYEAIRARLCEQTGIAKRDTVVINDCVAAYYAGSDRDTGVCVCAGTGVNACLVRPGREAECLGYAISVPHLGREGLRAAIDTFAGLYEDSALIPLALAHFGAPSMEALVMALSRGAYKSAKIKAFAPIVTEAARTNEVAREVCRAFSIRSARYAHGMLRKAGLVNQETDAVVSGGIFKEKSGYLYRVFQEEMNRLAPKAHTVNAAYEPVMGAMRQLLEPNAWENLKAQAAAYGLCRNGGTL